MNVNIGNAPLQRAAEPWRLSPVVLSGIVSVCEIAVTVISGLTVLYFYPGADALPELLRYEIAIVLATQVQLAAFSQARLYNVPVFRHPLRSAGRIFLVWTAIFAALVVIAFMSKTGETFSRLWVAAWYLGGYAAILAFRIILAFLVRHWTRAGRLETRVVIVGGDKRGEQLIQSLEASPERDIRICGVFDDRTQRVGPEVRGYPVLGSVRELVSFARTRRVDLLIVALPITAERRIVEMVKMLYVLPVDIRLAAHADALRLSPNAYSYVGGVPMLDVANRPVADWLSSTLGS